jgi:AcrR family transcriptional regulator
LSIQELKKKEKINRQNYIVDSAEKLFFSKGYDHISMGDIANEVGMSRTSLYSYFKNKEAIYFTIIVRAAKILNNMFKDSKKNNKKGIENLRTMGMAYYNFYNDYNDYYRIYHSFEYARFQNNPKYDISEILALQTERIKIMCETIVEGIEDGTIRSDVNPLELAAIITSTSNAIVNTNPETLKTLNISEKQFFEKYLKLSEHSMINIEKED